MNRYTSLSLWLVLLLLPISLSAQISQDKPDEEPWMEEFESKGIDPSVSHKETPWYQMMKREDPNVIQVMNAYESWFRQHPFQRSYETREYQKWIQREWTHIDAAGNILPLTPDTEGTSRYLLHNRTSYSLSSQSSSARSNSPWQLLGPMTWDRSANAATGSMGIGVIRSVAVDPNNPDKIILGTVSAGVWRTSNRGETWTEATQGLLAEETRDVAISRSDSRIMFAASNVGVLKSTDGGSSWNYTAFGNISAYPAVTAAYLIAISPVSSNILLCASSNRIFRSTDGGDSWEQTYANPSGETIRDIAFHPTNASIFYVLAQNGLAVEFLRSTDGGTTFTKGANGYPVLPDGAKMARALFALTPAAPDKVHVLIAGSGANGAAGLYGHFVSWDAGLSFSHLCCGPTDGPDEPDVAGGNPNIFHYNANENGLGQVTWDMGFAASDQDTNLLVGAGIFSWRSTDGGRSWESTPGIHYDVQNLAIGGGTIWVATDGGIFRSDDRYETITDKSDGINTMEVWGFGQGLKTDIMAIGAYHLPIFIRDDATYANEGFTGGWYPWSGADAMGADVNPIDDRWFYAKPWTNVRGLRVSDKSLTPTSQALGIDLGYLPLTNVAFHPNLYYTIVAPDHEDPKRFAMTRNNAASWETLRSFENSVYRVRISSSNSDYIYGIADGKLWLTTDGGKNWLDRSPNQTQTTGKALRDIVINNNDEREIWVALGGYQNARKMLRSTDAGESWSDYSGTLPKFEIRSMVYQEGSDGGLYVGTTLGIYYRNNSMTDWELHGTELPPTQVNFLHINYAKGKLRAGTSRGIWENNLYENTAPSARITADRNVVACSREVINFACGSALRYGPETTWEWSFPGGVPAESDQENPVVQYPSAGRYSVSLKVTDQFGTSTQTLTDFVEVLPSECSPDPLPGLALDLSQSTTDYVGIPPMDVVADSVTFVVWVKPDSIQLDWAAIYMHDAATGFGFKNGLNELQYHWNGDAWSWNSDLLVAPDEWSHIALSVTPEGATMYLNGVASHRTASHTPMDFSTDIARLGQDRGFGAGRNFKGQIDEFRIYNRALSQEEIRETLHLTRPANDSGLLLYYQFNEHENRPIYDRVGLNDGSLAQGSKRAVSTGPFGGGHSYRVTAPTGSNIEFPSADISVSFPTAWNEGELVATRISNPPDSLPEGMAGTSSHYWIVRSWEQAASFPSLDSLAFWNVGAIGSDDAATPSQLKLFRRDANEHQNVWGPPAAQGKSADVATGTITFGAEIMEFGQFVIGTVGSSTLSVESPNRSVEQTSLIALRTYPNPVTSQLHILYRSTSIEHTTEVHLYDGLGREVWQSSITIEPDITHGFTVDMADLPAGTYFIQVGTQKQLVVKM